MKPTPAIPDEVLPPDDSLKMELMPRVNPDEQFAPLRTTLAEKKAEALAITISRGDAPEVQKQKCATARRLRLDVFKATRVQAKKIHTELKAGVLEIGKKLDTAERTIRQECETIEAHLEEIETFAERERQRIEDETRAARVAEITPFLTGPLAVDLGKISEEQYRQQLTDARELHAMREERARKEREEAERKAAEEAAERERVRLENERLRKEAEEKAAREEAARKEAEAKAAEERKAREAEAKAAREAAEKAQREADAKLKAEREAAAARQREIEEKARQEREEQERKAAEERKRLEAEKAKAEAERKKLEKEKLERERAERERAAKEEAARKAAEAAPDVEKLEALAERIQVGEGMPSLANRFASVELTTARNAFVTHLRQIVRRLNEGNI